MSSDKRISFLKNQFSKIDDTTFEQIVLADPTPEKKYSTWLLRLFSKSKLELETLSTISEIIIIHSSLKQNIPVELRDINKFDSVVSFLFTMNKWLINRFVENEHNINYLRRGGELLFENENISIIKILNYEGSISYGSGTKWCTLKSSSFYEYSNSGHLYVITPKNDFYYKSFGKKSQLHFGKLEFRNDDNNEINLIDIICKNPELYEPFSKILETKSLSYNSEIGEFFNINNIDSSFIELIKRRGYNILKFVKTFSLDLTNKLFSEFGEAVYSHIPDSKEKTLSFVSTLEFGLKKIIQKAEIEIDDNVFKEAVKAFPENILLMNCEDEELWTYVIKEDAWLINKSPFIKDVNKLFEVIVLNYTILKYIVPVKIFNIKQRQEIAKKLIKELCENYYEYLFYLGEFSEKFQISLVNDCPSCVLSLKSPSDKVLILSRKLIQEKQKKSEKEINKNTFEYCEQKQYKDYKKYDYGKYDFEKYNDYEVYSCKDLNNSDEVFINEYTHGMYYRTKEGKMYEVNKKDFDSL